MEKHRVHTLLSVLTIALGAVLLVYMVTVESEPGAIPLLLIAVGSGWFFVTRARLRSHRE
jgi:hypothetical protein